VVDRLAQDLKAWGETVGVAGGSNNWVIGASRTAAGRPIIAGDPHLPPHLPPAWYLAHIRTPDWSVAGGTFMGTPGFAIGHNAFAAWAPTAGLVDNTDLYIEEVGPDGRSVREDGAFVACQVRREIIRVRWRGDVEEDVLVTPRGPVIGPALDHDLGAISIRGTWLDPRPIKGLMEVHRARSFEEFRRAFHEWPLMSLNMLYADESGTLGWQLVGETPRRLTGWDTMPRAGSDPDAGWLNGVARRIVAAKAPNAFAWALGAGFTALMSTSLLAERRTGHLVRLIREQPEGWFPDGWADMISDCLSTAVRGLREERGPQHRKWAWGDVRPLTLKHPMGRNRLLARVFNIDPFPWGGDTTTIGHAKPDPREPTANPLVIASMRMVLDVGAWDESRFSMPGGQSGNPFSPHYDDLLRLWRRGGGVPIVWSEDRIQEAAATTLRLLPEPPSE